MIKFKYYDVKIIIEKVKYNKVWNLEKGTKQRPG